MDRNLTLNFLQFFWTSKYQNIIEIWKIVRSFSVEFNFTVSWRRICSILTLQRAFFWHVMKLYSLDFLDCLCLLLFLYQKTSHYAHNWPKYAPENWGFLSGLSYKSESGLDIKVYTPKFSTPPILHYHF